MWRRVPMSAIGEWPHWEVNGGEGVSGSCRVHSKFHSKGATRTPSSEQTQWANERRGNEGEAARKHQRLKAQGGLRQVGTRGQCTSE